jgi:SAM-dependent methyltransferase
MGAESFYRRYWQDAGHAIPTQDPLHAARAEAIIGLLRRATSRRVVDAGAGAGLLTARYAHAAEEVVALDLSHEAIAAAPSLGAHVRFVQADLEATWPVPSDFADVVVSSEVIEHLFEFASYLREAARVLKPGGALYLTTPYHGRLKNVVLALWGFDRHFCSYDSGHIRFFTNAHLGRLLAAAGFVDVRFGWLGRIGPLAKSTVVTARKA